MKRKSVVLVVVLVTAFVLLLTMFACNSDKNVEGVTLNSSSMSLIIGNSATLVATVQPEDATNKEVIWSSSDNSVATVDQNGLVTAIKVGTAIITVKTVDGEKTATCTVNVTINPLDEVVVKNPPAVSYPDYNGGDTLVVGYSYFSNKFSPFFSKTGYDGDVADMTQLGLLINDREGNIIYNGIQGETHSYNGTDYLYQGIADCVVKTNADGTVEYSFTIRDDIFFSDGVHMTIDDAIFSMYVLSDPSYDGSSTFYTLPIEGMAEYRSGVTADIYTKYAGIADKIAAAGYGNDTFTDFTEDQSDSYWGEALQTGGVKFAQEIVDYVISKYNSAAYAAYMGAYGVQDITGNEGLQIAYGMRMWGFGSWTTTNVKDAGGTKGLVDGVYKNLYTPVTEGTPSFTSDGVGYVAATASTADDQLYYIVSNTDGVYVVAAYEGDRYAALPDGKFKDILGNVYDLETTFPTVEDYWENILTAYEYDLVEMEVESAGSSIRDLVKEAFIAIEGPKDPAQGGKAISNISGIKKTGNYSLTIKMTKFDATAIYKLGIAVAPLHYYGNRAEYKYTEDKFGFTKGDLSGVKSKTTAPMGAGAYKFKSFELGIVTFERNEHYYKGCPNIQNILFKETQDSDKVPGVISGTFDVTDPSFNVAAVNAIKSANGNDSLNGNTVVTSTVENLGYGYIGASAQNVSVGEDPDSTASKNLRKAFATIFAAYRTTAVASYYGDLASVIEYPISNTSWAAPRAVDAGYRVAYSVNVNGEPIYTANMTEPQRHAAALEAAKGFLIAAGYTWNAGSGTFTAAPAGAKLQYEIIVPGDNKGDHPSFSICTWAKSQLATIGITLDINDPADSNVLWDSLEAGTHEFWCAAWGATIDPDMYQVYHSSNRVGLPNSTESNHYGIADEELDELIMAARMSPDNAFRKATYKDCLDIIMDWGVEIPIYQRKNAIIFSPSRVEMDSITPDITTFWGWMHDIESIEMK